MSLDRPGLRFYVARSCFKFPEVTESCGSHMTITAADRRQLGRTGLSVSPVCIGTSPLASMSELYGYEVPQARAEATIRAVLASHFNFIDTSNNYGGGAAESRIGRALAAAGGPPPGLVLATKV